MADPKYANLPGIAHDQPDSYETSDLPEADQNIDLDYQDHSDSVETLHISANEAFGKFRGKQLDAKDVDFSDRIQRNKKKGYIAWSGEFELVPGGTESETPVQKYQRLNCELRELQDEIEVIKKNDEKGATQLVGLSKQTMALQDELAALNLEEKLGSELLKDLQDPRQAALDRLMVQLEGLKSKSLASGSKKPEVTGDGSSVFYELLMKPETARLEEQRRLAELDKRLETIEKAVGAAPDKMSMLSFETNQKSIFGAIQVLGSRLALLEPSHLDHIEGRLAALHQKMNTVAEKKQVLEDAEKQSKISELYDLVHQSESMATALPEVVDRLETLQGLHEQALHFSKALTQLSAVQEKLEVSLGNNSNLLVESQRKFSENVEKIQKNLEIIDQRLSAVTK